MVIKMRITKKGIIFTMVAVVISAIILASFFFSQRVPPDRSVSSTKIRINSINSYINQLDSYISSQIGASTRFALSNMSKEMIINDKYYPNPFDEEFISCLSTGYVSNLDGGFLPTKECGTDLSVSLSNIDGLAKKSLHINSALTLRNITIYQNSPWYVQVDANITVQISDSYADWNFNRTYTGNSSILGLPDPTYKVGVSGIFNSKDIFVNNFTTQIPWNGWIRYPSTLNILSKGHEYFQYKEAPSFLSRMDGQLNAHDSSAGIASLVFPNSGMPYDEDISHLDFTYWRQQACGVTSSHVVFEFFTPSTIMTPQERANLNVSELGNESINGTVVPQNLIIPTNMSNPNFYFSGGC